MHLANNEVHIWCCATPPRLEAKLEAAYHAMLSPDEANKVHRYRFARDRQQSLISRAMIRTACSHYLGQLTPDQWSFDISNKGKPSLSSAYKQINNCSLNFNLSHTKELIVLALCNRFDIGVDVEYVQRQNDTQSIAQRYFSAAEIEQLQQFPKAQQAQRFFDFWTLKESYIKACGQGLAIPLDSFSFNIDRKDKFTVQADIAKNSINSDISLSFHKGRQDADTNWQSFLFDISTEHRGALSIRTNNHSHSPFQLRFFNSLPLERLEEIRLPLVFPSRQLKADISTI